MVFFKGIGFPFIKKGKLLPAPAFDEELIKQSIIQLVMTQRGERIMRPMVGSNAKGFLFENADLVRAQVLKADILQVLGQFEDRISVRDIKLAIKDTTLLVRIIYVVLALQEEKQLTLGLPLPAPE